MKSVPQSPGLEVDHIRRVSLRRSTIRRLGAAAAGAVLALFATGQSVAAPLPAHMGVPGCVAPGTMRPTGAQWPNPPAMTINKQANYTANLQTNCGMITLSLEAAKAPVTVNSFVFLAGQHYFDHTHCHRLTTQGIFVLQCGDPTGTGSGGPGYKFSDENLQGATYPAGTVAMANAGPNTNGSQFFLVYQNSPLPPNYTPFGRITGGTDVLQNIAHGGTTNGSGDGAPAANVILQQVTTHT
ncbi:peptidylprolyl isomerase [Nocardia alni]|uniref:peptidylprolyl isomerase n=1 Tax=Nocardia alni TaxID=2815723 RepID=UPI0027E09497|nr:peptidylprolyl isomerase [Nocardia alni]